MKISIFENKIKTYNEGRKTKRPFVVVMKYGYGKIIANDYSIFRENEIILWYWTDICEWRVAEININKIKFMYPLDDDEQYELEGNIERR